MMNNEENNQSSYLNSFPPGYRFCPTDEELLTAYLIKKVLDIPLEPNNIKNVNIYQFNPQQLNDLFNSEKEKFMYFFTPRERKYPQGNRPNRAAGNGFWKATGVDRAIKQNNIQIGTRKTLVYYFGTCKDSTKTNWIMHEYKMENESSASDSRAPGDMRLDEYILCKIYHRTDKSENEEDDQSIKDEIPASDNVVSPSSVPPAETHHNVGSTTTALPSQRTHHHNVGIFTNSVPRTLTHHNDGWTSTAFQSPVTHPNVGNFTDIAPPMQTHHNTALPSQINHPNVGNFTNLVLPIQRIRQRNTLHNFGSTSSVTPMQRTPNNFGSTGFAAPIQRRHDYPVQDYVGSTSYAPPRQITLHNVCYNSFAVQRIHEYNARDSVSSTSSAPEECNAPNNVSFVPPTKECNGSSSDSAPPMPRSNDGSMQDDIPFDYLQPFDDEQFPMLGPS